MISKSILEQYANITKEIQITKDDIRETEDDIAKLLEKECVKDKVYGGFGGIQGFVIEGFPEKEYTRREKLLRNRCERLIKKENDLLETKEKIEKFIDEIQNSRDRIILKAIYLEKKTQQEIADELYIDRSVVSRIISKYL